MDPLLALVAVGPNDFLIRGNLGELGSLRSGLITGANGIAIG